MFRLRLIQTIFKQSNAVHKHICSQQLSLFPIAHFHYSTDRTIGKSAPKPSKLHTLDDFSDEEKSRMLEIKVQVGRMRKSNRPMYRICWKSCHMIYMITASLNICYQSYHFQLYEMFESGDKVCDPDIITPAQWRYILTLRSHRSRKREFSFIGLKHHLEKKKAVRIWKLKPLISRNCLIF